MRGFVSQVFGETLTPVETGAMLDAVCADGLSREEHLALTSALREHFGAYLLGRVDRPCIGKRSTGGVGDKVSLVVGPLAAACGLAVPVFAGQRCTHLEGTIRKLEAIPHLRTQCSAEALARQMNELGLAMVTPPNFDVGAGLSDLLAAEEVVSRSIPLAAASILSREPLDALDGIVFDVTSGSGALFPERPDARSLAGALVMLANELGCPAVAVLSAMDEPLGQAVGNAVEVEEAICCLRGHGPADLEEISVAITVEMIRIGFPGTSAEEARQQAWAALNSGSAADVFREMVRMQGGDPSIVDNVYALPQAAHTESVNYIGSGSGWVRRVDSHLVAEAASLLGAGRGREGEAADPAVGIGDLIKVGTKVGVGTPLGRFHINDDRYLSRAHEVLQRAVEISRFPISPEPRVPEIITADGLRKQ